MQVKHVSVHLNENAFRTLGHTRYIVVSSCVFDAAVLPFMFVRLDNVQEVASMWVDDHELASCIRLLPERADTSEATERIGTNPDVRARIDTHLNQCPEFHSVGRLPL